MEAMRKSISLFLGVITACALLMGCAGTQPGGKVGLGARWILVGPFPNPQDTDDSCPGFYRDDLVELGGEPNATLAPGVLVGGKPCIEVRPESGTIDFARYLQPNMNAVAYAYTECISEGGEYVLRMGSDDGLRVWLNGRMIVDHHAHRSVNPDDEAVSVTLVKGKNRLLAKVDQGNGGWGLAFRLLTPKVEDEGFGKLSHLGLAVDASGKTIDSKGDISFIVRTVPSFAVDLPVECRLYDDSGEEAARIEGAVGRLISISSPRDSAGFFSLVVAPAADTPDVMRRKFTGAGASGLFFRGDVENAFTSTSAKAREAARKLPLQEDGSDLASTLEFLADRLEGKLHPTLETPERKLQAAGFVFDILREIGTGNRGLLRGYRQYAYRSEIDGSLQPYCLYVPDSYDPARKYGLVVALHGYTVDDYSGGSYLARIAPEDFIVLSAFGRGDMGYRSVGEKDVLDVMDRVMERLPIDPDRVYLSGTSMGGLGTWRIGSLFPDRFAAIAPICGWCGTDLLENLRNVAVLAIHGDADPSVPVAYDREATRRLSSLGFSVRYDELPGVNHDAWGGWIRSHPASSIFDFFRAHTRNPSPERITAKVPNPRYGKHYWIRVDELSTDGVLAVPGRNNGQYSNGLPALPPAGSVDAKRESKDSISVSTQDVTALTVDVDLAGLDLSKPIEVTIDGVRLPVPQGVSTVSLVRRSGNTWSIEEKPSRPDTARHNGGGISDLFTEPLLIVYGTRDAKRSEALELAARTLADWAPSAQMGLGVKAGAFPMKADVKVSKEDMQSRSLILIGNARENAVSAKAARLQSFYSPEGDVNVSGSVFKDSGLAVTFPSPFNPRLLIGYIDMPRRLLPGNGSVLSWFAAFPYRFRIYYVNGTGAYPCFCPDVMVLTPNPIEDAWSGWFDRNWENLKGK